jgi:hypothetical protein
MNRTLVASVHKILLVATLIVLLFCTPLLAGQEKEPRVADHISFSEWFADLWIDLTAWITGKVVPQPPPGSFLDGRCAVDPNGCPDGE